jgi:hypothetical protein
MQRKSNFGEKRLLGFQRGLEQGAVLQKEGLKADTLRY